MKIINKVVLFSMLTSMPLSCESCIENLPNPEDSPECQAATLELEAARQALTLARQRLQDYLSDGLGQTTDPEYKDLSSEYSTAFNRLEIVENKFLNACAE